jgi:menaquinone-dependent protoporphyrinogen IX oxidase
MNKAVVIYKSTYGTAKAYAQQIALEMEADLLECSKAKPSRLTKYDTIIFGGGIYAGQIAGSSQLRSLCKKLPDKSFVVFSVGFTPKAMINVLEKVRTNSLRGIPLQNIRFFHFSGSIDYTKLNLVHKLLLSGKRLSLAIKSKEKLTKENNRFIKQYGKGAEFTLDSTQALIACLKS